MKVILNMAAESVPNLDRWYACQGLKLRETEDGSLELLVTDDFAASQKADDDMVALLARIKQTDPAEDA